MMMFTNNLDYGHSHVTTEYNHTQIKSLNDEHIKEGFIVCLQANTHTN